MRHRARKPRRRAPAAKARQAARDRAQGAEELDIPMLGITGTGGSGKSSLTDELIRRFRLDQDDSLEIAVIAVDPSRAQTGGALLGDRIRMNAIDAADIFMRSLATRDAGSEISAALPEVDRGVQARRLRSDRRRDLRHRPGRRGDRAAGRRVAVRDDARVRRREPAREDRHARFRRLRRHQQVRPQGRRRTRCATCASSTSATATRSTQPPDAMPVFGTIAVALQRRRRHRAVPGTAAAPGRARPEGRSAGKLPPVDVRAIHAASAIVPPARARYLAEIADTVRAYHAIARAAGAGRARAPAAARPPSRCCAPQCKAADGRARRADRTRARRKLDRARRASCSTCGRRCRRPTPATNTWSRSATRRCAPSSPPRRCRAARIRKVALPRFEDHGEILKWLLLENVPGSFPYTAGVFAFKRENEDPTRMFAGEGDAFRTNRASSSVSKDMPAQAPLDRVRLGHAVRLRAGRAPRHLRQGRQLGRVDRDAGRHEGAVRRLRPVQPEHLGVDDHQRPGADHAGDVPQHRDRPAGGEVPRRQRPRARPRTNATRSRHGRSPPCAARCRPTSSRKTRGRTPASSRPSSH